jgi:hypothetical protein
LLLFFLTSLVAPLFLKPLVTRILREKLEAATGNLYQVQFRMVSFSLVPGHILLEDFSLLPDSNRMKELHPKNSYEVHATQIQADGIRFYTYLFSGSWRIGNIRLKNADIQVFHDPSGRKVKPGKEGKKFRLYITGVTFQNTVLDVWNRQTNEKRFTCTLSEGRLKKVNIRNAEPLEIGYSRLTFTPVQLQTAAKKELKLDYVCIETRNRTVNVYSRNVKVNELADALGDSKESFFQEDAFVCSVDSFVFSANDYTQWPHLLRKNKGILIDRVYLHHPVFRYYPGKALKKDSTGLDPFANRSGSKFLVRKFEIKKGEVEVWEPEMQYRLLSVGRFDLTVDALQNAPPEYKFPVWAHDISLSTDSIHILTQKGMYRTDLSSVAIGQSQEVVLHDLYTRPTVTADSFFRHTGYQTDYTQLHIAETRLEDIRFRKLLSDIVFECREIHFITPVLQLFRDKNYPLNTVKRPDFPQQQIRDVPVPFAIDSLRLDGGKIFYDEIVKDGKDTGHFSMEDIRITTHHLTNQPEQLLKEDSLQFFFEGKIYGKGLLKGVLTLYMNDPSGLHKLEGIIGPLQAQLLNSITVPAALLMIRGGIVNGGSFRFTADETASEGTLLLKFERLKIALLETRQGSGKLKVNKMKTFVANVFLVKENPVPGKEPVVSRISYERDPSRWVINYWWKSLLSGINNIVLARKDQMLELKRETDALKNLQKEKEEYRKNNGIE